MKRIYVSKYLGSTSNLNYKFILLTFCLVGNKPQFRNVEQNPVFLKNICFRTLGVLPSQSFTAPTLGSHIAVRNILVISRGMVKTLWVWSGRGTPGYHFAWTSSSMLWGSCNTSTCPRHYRIKNDTSHQKHKKGDFSGVFKAVTVAGAAVLAHTHR